MSLFFVLILDIAIGIVLTFVSVVSFIKWRNKKREKDRDVYENGDYDCEDGVR